MHKLYSFVWEKDKAERAAEQKPLQSHPDLANTPALHWKSPPCQAPGLLPVPHCH